MGQDFIATYEKLNAARDEDRFDRDPVVSYRVLKFKVSLVVRHDQSIPTTIRTMCIFNGEPRC